LLFHKIAQFQHAKEFKWFFITPWDKMRGAESEEWIDVGRYADFKIQKLGNKRRLVDAHGNIAKEYEV